MTHEHEALVGIVGEPLDGVLQLGPLGGGDGVAIEGKENRFDDTLVGIIHGTGGARLQTRRKIALDGGVLGSMAPELFPRVVSGVVRTGFFEQAVSRREAATSVVPMSLETCFIVRWEI